MREMQGAPGSKVFHFPSTHPRLLLAQEDETFLQTLFTQLVDDETDDAKRLDLVLFLKEFCSFSQTLQNPNRDNFFKVGVTQTSAQIKRLRVFVFVGGYHLSVYWSCTVWPYL